MDVNNMDNYSEKIYCGACGEAFESGNKLMSHLDTCTARSIFFPMVWQAWGGKDPCHNIASFMVAIKKSIPLIKKYAWVISNDIDTIKRAEIHRELCDSLEISKKDFQPFEGSEIREIPNQEQAELIIWKAIRNISRQKMEKGRELSDSIDNIL
ncbi:MAG: hypothetical protein WC503_04225 [Candidatus Shapirobacteria bacterium]